MATYPMVVLGVRAIAGLKRKIDPKYMRRYRAKQSLKGIVRVEVRIPACRREELLAITDMWRRMFEKGDTDAET